MGRPGRLIISHSHKPTKASTMCSPWWKKTLDGWKHNPCPKPLPRTLSWALKSKSYGNMAPQKELKPMPAGSMTDPPLAKAKPINDGGSASGITYLSRGKKNCATTAGERSENM
ncbi:hypothetical protein QYF61_023868 [Mycteria americana]|uniref:Uncharacterized protein n=1 Tax=Mycteria americana TaxID=33587 RepID=A0AAN7Q8A1_MYCAM|nr:hypothetical protein QYF61_023868 [Mycteria americana]